MLDKAACRFGFVIFILFITFMSRDTSAAVEQNVYVYTLPEQDTNLLQVGTLLKANNGQFPKSSDELNTWLEGRQPQTRTSFFGGSYWLVLAIENRSDLDQLVLHPYNILVSRIETRIYDMNDASAPVARYITGGEAANEFAFHYGNKVQLDINKPYMLITKFESDYFYTPPKLVLKPYQDFFAETTTENMVMLLCFGVGIALGLYNLLIYFGARDVTHLYYALFTGCWVFAWSQFFHIPDQLFGFYSAHLHWLGFTLIPITNILFYNSLLKLKETFPRLSIASIALGVIATLGVPFAVMWPGFGFIWATVVTGCTLCLGLFIGIRSWLSGFKPARYFVLAYLAMAIPNMIGNLTNLGLLPPVTINLYLLGLIGTSLDAMLLAFAVANKFSLLHEDNVELTKNLEHKVQLRTQELEQLAAELRDASEAKSRFLANMSHEIRTPMTSIIGYADGIVLGDIKPHERKHGMGVILQNSRHVLGLINDILDMSKIEANRLEIELVETDLFATIAHIESLLGKQIRDKGLMFSVNYHFPLPDTLVIDPTRLRQILLNLASNALKFTTVGRITLDVLVKHEQLFIEVRDTGIGMTESEQKELFNAFYQADSSISRKYGGTGLGLNISKSLANKLDGDITVHSEVGAGSTFTLQLNLYTTDSTRWVTCFDDIVISSPAVDEQTHKANLTGEVLLAEDHPDNRKLITRILERMGLSVTAVENGQDAVQASLDKQFDLILLDIQMPVMDGQQALNIMQVTGNTTPVVALTANTMKHEIDRYLQQGFIDHIAKPIDRTRFSQQVASYLALPLPEDVKLPDSEFKQLKNEYIKGLSAQRDDIQMQLQKADFDGLKASVHLIKGAAGMFECDSIYQQSLLLDRALKKDSVTIDSRLVSALLTAIDSVVESE